MLGVMETSERILKNAKAMAKAASSGVGADVVIIVNSSTEQALFWQERLTDSLGMYSSGAVIKSGALVLSVSETNWEGGAGNGLGTLNGFVQAARKACEFKIIDTPENPTVVNLVSAFMAYAAGKSIFMIHTAGKGTRIAPLPGSECNSKSNIKLPGIVNVDGEKEALTILEAVLMVTSIYAPSRGDRMSVFWGDQVIINENDITFDGSHHVEIFGEFMPLTDDIKAYGVLIPCEDGSCSVREKFSKEQILKLLPSGESNVYRSVGSFTISLSLLNALIKLEEEELTGCAGSLNTDPDWWQPLTSARDEYINVMEKKGISSEETGKRWDVVTDMWEAFKEVHLGGKIGFTDIGPDSLWWDYGQNSYYLKNMELLTEKTTEGEAARIFFGVEEEKVQDSDTGSAEADNSIVLNSVIKKGKLKNCVVVSSYIKEIQAENSVIIGSTVLKLKSAGALCYNVAEIEVALTKGEVLVNVFHPEKGRIPMKTHVSRDGRNDWEGGVRVGENAYTYPEIAVMMKHVKVQNAKKIKQEESEKIKNKKD